MDQQHQDFFKSKVLGHPAGLFVLFFTEMWERFSFYGMRVLLINFLTMAVVGTNPGWAWTTENAGALFGTYAGLLYLTPILGGMVADRYIGYRWAVFIGALIMTLGHASMAIETEFSLYAGLGLLVIGTGFFKPNMTSIISEMYKYLPEKKDGAYTIFYMGVNAGAFFGMMLCGYLAEKVGWSWGFGLAGIFMFLGMLQFLFAKPLFGKIGGVPDKTEETAEVVVEDEILEGNQHTNHDQHIEVKRKEKRNPFTLIDKILILISATIGLLYLINDPVSKIGQIDLLPQEFLVSPQYISGPLVITIIGFVAFLILIISRISRYDKIIRGRMIAVIIFAIFTVFFFLSFEQGATSLVLFARDYTNRTFFGTDALIYNVVNTLLTVVPLAIVSWVLVLLFRQTFRRIKVSNLILSLSFLLVWGIVIWMLLNDFNSKSYEVTYQAVKIEEVDEQGTPLRNEEGAIQYLYTPVTESTEVPAGADVVTQTARVSSREDLQVNQAVAIHSEIGKMHYLKPEAMEKVQQDYKNRNLPSQIIDARVSEIKEGQVEITTSWFSILNSFFIIAFASLFTKWWDSKYNPPAALKYALGLIVMGIGFGILAYGSKDIPQGAIAGTVRVSMVWLVLAYLFHTLGELCLSPVGLSYVSKLVPPRMIAFMFGMWYLAIAIGNKLAGSLGGMIEEVQKNYNMSTFFLIFTITPIVAGLIVAFLHPVIKRLMHGVK